MTIDLHTHSICSDGSMTPTELVDFAKFAGLSAIALTDHDTVSGVEEAVKEGKRIGLEVVPAIELSAISDTETHILGYYIDPQNKILKDGIEHILNVRYQRQEETCKKLNNMGFDITMDEVKAIASRGMLCRAHFATIMVQKGYVSSVKEAFDLYLSHGKMGYSSKQALTDVEAIKLIKDAGGMAFCAHLHLTKKSGDELENFIIHLKSNGLCGIEGYYTEYTPEMEEEYHSLAKRHGLILSGGTDFHGEFKPHIQIGTGFGNMAIPYSILENIKSHK